MPHKRDTGLLGPDSVAWRVVGHPGSLVGGLRSLIIQSLHPLPMAGVAQHSDYLRRPMSRLRGTAQYVAATTFGDTATAHAAAERVKRIHAKVRGVDPITGSTYSADDPESQIWVHCVEWHSFLASYRALGGSLTAEEQDRYILEGVRIGSLLGTPQDMIPASTAELREYFAAVRPRLCVSADSRRAIDFVLHPPVTRELLPFQAPMRLFARAAQALVPRDLRRLAGIETSSAADALAISLTRSAVGVLGMPFVRELGSSIVGPAAHELGKSAARVRREHESQLRRAA